VVLPPDYTRRAFELADRLFPKNVRLAVNDAWTVANDAYAAFAQKLIRDGARVDEVGYQKHIFNPRDLLSVASGFPCLTNSQTWDVADETNRLAEIDARTARPIHISEVTIPSPRGLAGLTDAEADAIQARVARAYYRLWFSWPSVERITYWNLVDGLGAKNERMSSGWYNRDMTKKAVWHAMDRLFNHEWRTRLTAKADAAGRLSFRGFKGRYRLTWRRADGTAETRELNLER
jgi:GH35 family endo-1,4-beta-xylanase